MWFDLVFGTLRSLWYLFVTAGAGGGVCYLLKLYKNYMNDEDDKK